MRKNFSYILQHGDAKTHHTEKKLIAGTAQRVKGRKSGILVKVTKHAGSETRRSSLVSIWPLKDRTNRARPLSLRYYYHLPTFSVCKVQDFVDS
jgi:hypothetical protein